MIVSSGMGNSSFLWTAKRKEPLVNSVLRHAGHGIFLCRGDRFASIDIAAAEKSMRQRNSEPHSLKPEQRVHRTTENTRLVELLSVPARKRQATPSPATRTSKSGDLRPPLAVGIP